MIVLYALLFIVIGFLCYIFFAPFYLEIDTSRGLYRIRLHWLASISIKPVDDFLIIELKLAGFTKQMDRLSTEVSPTRKHVFPVKKKHRKRTPAIQWSKVKSVIASFRIKKCRIRFDSGDVQLNGMLFPLAYWISSYSGKDVRVNFTGENEIILEMKNSLARMSWAYISS